MTRVCSNEPPHAGSLIVIELMGRFLQKWRALNENSPTTGFLWKPQENESIFNWRGGEGGAYASKKVHRVCVVKTSRLQTAAQNGLADC